MENSITIIKAEDFGLEQKNVEKIDVSFKSKEEEKSIITKIYNDLIKKDINAEVSKEARKLRLTAVKLKSGITAIHKTEKAYSLAYGKYCDAWKNKELEPLQQIIDNLLEIEKAEERAEAERLKLVQKERAELMRPYYEDADLIDFTAFEEEDFKDLLEVKKMKQEREEREREAEELLNDRVEMVRHFEKYLGKGEKLPELTTKTTEEEFKAIRYNLNDIEIKFKERERKEGDLIGRKNWVEKLVEYRPNVRGICLYETLNIDTTVEEFTKMINELNSFKDAHLKEQERIRKENERLRKEAEDKRLEHEKELQRRAKIEADEVEERAKAERKRIKEQEKAKAEQERIDKELRAKHEEELRIANEKAKKVADELKAKEQKERAKEQEEQKRIQDELNKGDAEKVKDLISDLNALKSKYEFKSAKNKSKYKNVGGLIDKVVNYINE